MRSKQNIDRLFKTHRPPSAPGRLDLYLPGIAQELREALAGTQETFIDPACQLDATALDQLAVALVEFAEDIHTDAGLWRTLESYQSELCGTPLPLFLKPGEKLAGRFDSRRIRYFLYILWAQLQPDCLVSPSHKDLAKLAETTSEVLSASFRRMPKDSSIVRFLRTPNQRAWDVKRKLVWAGRHSYLFRHQCASYHKTSGVDITDVGATDDFICQHCTDWCGLGVIDLLAGALDLPEADRLELRTWYERHQAFYHVIEFANRGAVVETMNVINLVNDQPYRIRLEMEKCPFIVGQVVLGSLVPWRGEWYWSGSQRTWEKVDAAVIAMLKKQYLEKNSQIAYRYRPDLAAKARASVREHYGDFVKYHGGDLVVFPDGLSLAAAHQKRMREVYSAHSEGIVENVMKRHGLRNPWPTLVLPDDLLKHNNGIGAFFNADEGEEWMIHFNDVLSAFRKQAAVLTDDEVGGIRGIIESESISPAFVQRLVREHGSEAIGRAYMIRDFQPAPDLDWLLRRFKGKYYRRRYPAISFVEGEIADKEP